VESKGVTSKADVGVRDLQMMVKKMPQFQKELTSFSAQLSMAGDCMKAFEQIKNLCAVEQVKRIQAIKISQPISYLAS
jgi:hypothetical protein